MLFSNALEHELSENNFMRAISFFTLIAAAIVAVATRFSLHWSMNILGLLVLFVISVVCIFIFTKSDEPLISFAGVSGLCVCLGLMVGPILNHYKMPHVIQAIVLTTLVMGGMSLVGITFPALCRGWGSFLVMGLMFLIVAQFGQLTFIALGFPEAAHIPFLDWIGIFIFSGFVAYDWAEALQQDRTWDNAIDASGGLILDAVNLFLRFLEVAGSSSED